MRQLVIDRTKWLRGLMYDVNHNAIGSSLLTYAKLTEDSDSIDLMCCLGFDCLNLGFTPEQIESCEMPEDAANNNPEAYALHRKLRDAQLVELTGYVPSEDDDDDIYTGVARSTDITTRLASIKDDRSISDETREYAIKQVYGTINVNVEFIN